MLASLVLIILAGVLVVGSILGLVAYIKITSLEARLARIERQISGPVGAGDAAAAQAAAAPPTAAPEPEATPVHEPAANLPAASAASQSAGAVSSAPTPGLPSSPGRLRMLYSRIADNWMIWLGGVSLALAGVFLVVYSVERGLLGPTARIVLATLAGLVMQTVAEVLRQKRPEGVNVYASMAAAGSITLFATVLAAHHLYDMIGINAAFVLLAAISFITMLLALLHGPVAAGLGLLGAYAVPVLVASGSGATLVALSYAWIVTTAGLGLLRYVCRTWLWLGLLTGASAWWLLTLNDAQLHGPYLAALAYVFSTVVSGDWWLSRNVSLESTQLTLKNYVRSATAQGKMRQTVWLTLTAAFVISFSLEFPGLTSAPAALAIWTPFLLLALWAARTDEHLNLVPWFTSAGLIIGALCAQLALSGDRWHIASVELHRIPAVLTTFFTFAALLSLFATLWYSRNRFKPVWASLAMVTPILWAGAGYLLTEGSRTNWGLTFLLFGVVYLLIATVAVRREAHQPLAVWGYFSAHLSIGVAAAVAFAPHTLTFVMGLQLVSLAWLMRAFAVDLAWLVKLLATLLVLRLTLNPWLLDYPVDEHWTLLSYGGSLLGSVIALFTLRTAPRQPPFLRDVQPWLEGISMHFLVLFLWTELRFWLYAGDVFHEEFTALEVSLNILLFGAVSLVYYRRSLASAQVAWLYRCFSAAAGVFAMLNYLLILFSTLVSARWVYEDISTTPLLNQGLLMYAVPVCLLLLISRWGMPFMRRGALWLSGLGFFVLVNMQIRHLWTGRFQLDQTVASGEMMTYSVVWLVVAVSAMLIGSSLGRTSAYRLGLLTLAAVIAKIFLLDMADLQGLLRVASFFALGLALLGLSWMHTRLKPPASERPQEI